MDDIVVQEFVNAIKDSPTDPNTTYSAKVSRVDKDGTVWVNLFGSEKETPTASTSSEVKRGDSVNVNWRNNKLYIDGNYSNPSSGVESTKRVEGVANDAKQIAGIAYEAANNAVADAERARVAAESAEADALSAAQSSASAGESASRAQAASEAAQLAALSSITTDTIHYLATDLDSGITTADPPAGHGSWSTTIQTMTATNKYLWTYHTYTTAGGATRDTTPALTGTYGEKGADGTSVTILGSYNTLAELEQAHPTGARGDAYMVFGDLYVWNGSAWENVGQIQGPQGPQGIQGNSVTVSSIAYAVTSTESEPQSYPYLTVPTVPEGSWLWTKTTYSDGNVAISKSKQGVSGTNGTNGRDGRDGTNGTNGTNGISVSAVQPQYYLSTSSAEAIGGSWSTSLTYVTGKFIWTRDYITYSDNTHGTSTAIYNQALTESCYNAAEALGLISEQQQYFYHDSLGAHVLSSPNTTGVRYRTDIEGAGLEINELSGSTEKSVATFGAEFARIGKEDEAYVLVDADSVDVHKAVDNNDVRGVSLTGGATQYITYGEVNFVPDNLGEEGSIDSGTCEILGSWAPLSTEQEEITSESVSITINAISPNRNGEVDVARASISLESSAMYYDDTSEAKVVIEPNLWIGGHDTPVGHVERGQATSAVRVPNATSTAVCSVELGEGTWIVTGIFRAPTNANGYRMANISSVSGENACNYCIPAVSGNVTQGSFTRIIKVDDLYKEYYLNVYQTSGGPLDYPAGWVNYLEAIRIV